MKPAVVVDLGGSGGSMWRLNGGDPLLTYRWEGTPDLDALSAVLAQESREGEGVLLATPGQVDERGGLHAANLSWSGVHLGCELGLSGRELRWINDAALIAASERRLHGLDGRVLVLVLGTGLGIAMADDARAATVMWAPGVEGGHLPTGLDLPCPCGRRGCLEVALKAWLDGRLDSGPIGEALARLLDTVQLPDAIVVCGGRVRSEGVFDRVVAQLPPGLNTLPSAAPDGEKSAAPYGSIDVWANATRL